MKLSLAITVALMAIPACWCSGADNPVAEPGTDDAPTAPASLDDAKSTVVVATLEAPIPEGRNAIWCASFLAAWKTLAEQVTQGPVALNGAEDLVRSLNIAADPRPDVPKEALYVAAGRVEDGIIQRIQREVVQKFPGKDVPAFGRRADTVAYAYQEANIKFPKPYFQNPKALEFTDSAGRKVPVASFGICPEGGDYQQPRHQPRVLFDSGAGETMEFAIDLDPNSQPSQIVVARIAREPTLAAAVARVNKETKDAGKKYDSGLALSDVMLVPDLFWNIAHRFTDLEGRTFANPKLAGLPLGVARQDTLFQLCRSGAVLKSEARFEAAGELPLPPPRHLLCDRPFLIIMRQRGTEAPYFAMWVDNAEVLSPSGHVSTPLHDAALKGDKGAVASLLADPAGVNARDVQGATPLHHAARGGHSAVVELLLTNHAAIDARDKGEATPLHLAAQNAHAAVATLLLANRATVNAKDGEGATPLLRAAQNGHMAMVELLLTKGGAVDDWDDEGNMPLLHAAGNGHTAVVKLLLANGAGVNDWGGYATTPLHAAAEKGHAATVEVLLAQGAGVDSINWLNETPLLLAAKSGHKEVVELLLAKGASIKSRVMSAEIYLDYIKRGILVTTPLHLAAARGAAATVELLLAKGANLNGKDWEGKTPWCYAATCGDKATVALLLAKGAAVNEKFEDGKTPLHLAAAKADQATVELLLAKGADIHAEDGDGSTPMHSAAFGGNEATVELLLAKGAELDSRNRHGFTPLLTAARAGRKAAAEVLLAKGADVNAKDKDGGTALRWARESKNKEVVALLLAHHAPDTIWEAVLRGDLAQVKALLTERPEWVREKGAFGTTALHLAAGSNFTEIVAVLLANGAEVNAKDNHGRTPLHYAVPGPNHSRSEESRKDSVALLLANGAKVNAKDKGGLTPLACTEFETFLGEVQPGLNEVVELLLAKGADANARIPQDSRYGRQMGGPSGEKRAGEQGTTLLHKAAAAGNAELVTALLAHHAKVNAKDIDGFTPLRMAAMECRMQVVELLLTHGANVNAKDHEGRAPWQIPLVDPAVRRLLLDQSADLDVFEAVRRGSFEKVQTMVDANPELARGKDRSGDTLLLWVIFENGPRALVESLLAKGADINAGDSNIGTPLINAVRWGRRDLVDLLLAKGADVNAAGAHWTALNLAAGHGDRELVELLLAHRAEVNPKPRDRFDSGFTTPLHCAAEKGAKDIVELLLARQAKVDAVTHDGATALHLAANEGHLDVVELLLAHQANVNAKVGEQGGSPYAPGDFVYGSTPLHLAVEKGNQEMVELLLGKGADVNARDGLGRTPLLLAAGMLWPAKESSSPELDYPGKWNHAGGRSARYPREIPELLLAKGADVLATSEGGWTAMDVAVRNGRRGAGNRLLGGKAEADTRNHEGFTPLHRAATAGNEYMAAGLLRDGADANAKSRAGETPLHVAARGGHTKVAKALLEAGAKVNARNNEGSTPLQLAERNGRKQTAQFLRQHGGHE